MPQSGLTVVKEETKRLNANNVAAFLRSKGLDAIVSSDDAGGELPMLDQIHFVQVLVPDSEAEQARALLAEAEAGSDSEDAPTDSEE